MDAKYQYSYADGDQWFQWSPDSQWILSDFIGIGGWNNKDVVLLKADGKGEMVNLTESGYSDSNAKWVLGGKAMIWNSDRADTVAMVAGEVKTTPILCFSTSMPTTAS